MGMYIHIELRGDINIPTTDCIFKHSKMVTHKGCCCCYSLEQNLMTTRDKCNTTWRQIKLCKR